MKILILISNFPPFVNSAARLYSELSESLAKMGHDVTVITHAHPGVVKPGTSVSYYKNENPRNNNPGRLTVVRIWHSARFKNLTLFKVFRFISSFLLMTVKGAFHAQKPDALLVYSPPLYNGLAAAIISAIRKAPFVLNIQDIHPKVLFDMGIIKNRIFKWLLIKSEMICYNSAQSFIVYSQGNRDYLLQKRVQKKIHVIPNWANIEKQPSKEKRAQLRKNLGSKGKFVVTYAGSMWETQRLEILIDAAEILSKFDDILFVLAGAGPSKPALKKLIHEKSLKNMVMLPTLPKDDYVALLYESDVCFVILSKDVPKETVPGKIADLMACGRPIIAAVHQKGDAAALIAEPECGIIVLPESGQDLADAVLVLYHHEPLRNSMGENAKNFADKNLSRFVCTKRYADALFASTKSLQISNR